MLQSELVVVKAPRAPAGCGSQLMIRRIVELAVGMLAAAGTMPAQVAEGMQLELVEEEQFAQKSVDTQPPMPVKSSPHWNVADDVQARKMIARERRTVAGPGAGIAPGTGLRHIHSTAGEGFGVPMGKLVTDTGEGEAASEPAVVQTEKADTAG